ncbi:MAG: hypothetical protein U5L96_06795 [Owenweeksia sp.]|nr:hypothetical protein [Owenweeksia sp.]
MITYYEGCDMGIVVTRGRLMTDDFKLTARAKSWIKAIRAQYRSLEIQGDKQSQLIGSLTK